MWDSKPGQKSQISEPRELVGSGLTEKTDVGAAGGTWEMRVQELHAGYGKKEVLRGISLEAAKGEMIAVVGPNGSGKSTLLKVIAGFLAPERGSVWFSGQAISALAPDRRVKLGLAYFMQGGRVFPNLTVRENLDMGAMAVKPAEREENTAAVLGLFPNIRNLASRRAGLLSGGERQGLALTMLLIRRPRLLLLDEPSAGLSPKLVQDMLNRVQEVNRNWGTTVLLVEQNIQQALNTCERALALVNGRIALETQRPTDWLASSQLEHLFLGYQQD